VNPDISIVVPSCGRPDRLKTLLECLARQQCGPGETFEVVVGLDGGGTVGRKDDPPYPADGMEALFAEPWQTHRNWPFPIRVLPLPRVGISAAKNAAIAQATGCIVLLVNDDVEPAADFVHQHATAQSAGHSIVLGASPWVRRPDQTLFDEALARTRMVFFYEGLEARGLYDFRHAWNLNLSVDRRLLEHQPGPFAEALRPCMYEDLELAYRLLGREPGVFYHPAARAAHRHRYDLRGYLEREVLLGVMAQELYRVNAVCARAVFGSGWPELADQARQALAMDAKDAGGTLEQLTDASVQPWTPNCYERELRLFYAAHLSLKRRAFRCGVVAALDDEQAPWTARPQRAVQALMRDPVFQVLYGCEPDVEGPQTSPPVDIRRNSRPFNTGNRPSKTSVDAGAAASAVNSR